MKVDTETSDRSGTCTHWPPTFAVIPTRNGYEARCLTCGQTGPERESKYLAWTALMRSRREPPRSARQRAE